MNQPAMIYIHGFGTEYVPDYVDEQIPDPLRPGKLIGQRKLTGKMKERDWVEYSPLGSIQKTVIREWLEIIKNVLPLTGKGGDNPAVQMAHSRWDAIRPRYEAWKNNQELPLDGTPLAAWNGISRQLCDVLKTHGVRTIEELSALTDTHIQSIGIMGLRGYIDNAKRFLTVQSSTVVTDALAKKDQEIAELKAQMVELVAMVKEAQQGAVEPPKRRGRPPKPRPEQSVAEPAAA